ncbi:M10 family metallopeptidase C-terminal domain-containing protein [Duganella sp. HH101]|uniref:M10 family metallopeptidase C-terminal domain-containing protein n=1 Tax=Duganella sp. HH101 TaxID=1781066 RepID=UPI0008743E55|nr:M10 family metallopeptidase C-terminal domain-containing protein [Duganella sp. HH101]OFA00350.1 serralysin C precursor [Duganella sp. HH101]
MSTPTTSSPTSSVKDSGNLIIDALLGGIKWGAGVGSGISITYSFPFANNSSAVFSGPRGGSYSDLNEPHATQHYGFDATQQAAAQAALQAWANVANIKPVQLADTATSVGDIRFAWTSAAEATSDGGSAWGWANYPDSTYPSGGDVWINTDPDGARSNSDWSVGSYNYMSLIHELGHALGLKHPFEDTPVDPARANRQYSLMAYDDAPHSKFVDVTETANSASWKSYNVVPNAPMLDDIAAMQYVYGANTTYHTGDDVYTFDPATPFLTTIWDAGGSDTISISNFSNGSLIDLQQGHYSSIHIPSDTGAGINWQTPPPTIGIYDGTNNLAIAYGAVIENATGGSGDDTLIGNSSANRLQGNGGHNTIDGGGGIDTAVYTGAFGSYTLAARGAGYTVSSRADPGQGDTLSNIERLKFADGTMALSQAGLDEDAARAPYVAMAQKFYIAYFGNPADAGGLSGMVGQMMSTHAPTTTGDFIMAYYTNATVKAMVDNFALSSDPAALGNGSDRDFLTAIYAHVLGRAADEGGLAYWANSLAAGLPRPLAALSVLEGAERNTSAQGLIDGALVNNRLVVAANFTALIDTPAELAGYSGSAAASVARALVANVNQNTDLLAYEATVMHTLASMSGGVQSGAGPHEVVLVGSSVEQVWA